MSFPMPIGEFKSRTSVRSAWKRATVNRSQAKGGALFEIAVGRPGAQPGAAPPIPAFVSAAIAEGGSPSPTTVGSLADLLQSLWTNGFAILAGVDSAEVCAFVDSVESSEQGAKRE
jgi:hypothetical protein